MTLEQITNVISGHYTAGKRALGALRRATRADVPEGAASSDRLSTLCEAHLRAQVKAFDGGVERVGLVRWQFSGTGETAKQVQSVSYAKSADLAASIGAAIDTTRQAWKDGKPEPRNARRQILNAVYFPVNEGGLPQTGLYSGVRDAALSFLDECRARNESATTAKADEAKADEAKRAADAAKLNAKAAARKQAQAAAAAKEAAKQVPAAPVAA